MEPVTKPETKKRTVITTETLEIWIVRHPNIEGSEWPMNYANGTIPPEILPLLPSEHGDDNALSDES